MAVIWQCQHGLNSPMLNMLDVAVLGLAACLCRKPQNWYERQVRGFCVQNPYQWLVTASSLDCHCYKSGSPNKTHPLLVELLPFVPGLPTHTPLTARLDLATRWLHHCFMSNMGWWWHTHVWGMDRVCIGYGTGYGTKSMTFPDCQKVWLSTAAPWSRGTGTGSHSESIVMNHGKSRMIGGMDRGVWIACGPGPLIHTLYFDVPFIYIYK